MDFEPSETQALIQKTARDVATRILAPRAAELDATERFPLDNIQALAELGLLAIAVPPEAGGAGAGTCAYALAIHEIARACASTAVIASVTNMVGETIARFGTEAQRHRYCPGLADGTRVAGSFALSEPNAGSDPGGMRTTAQREAASGGAPAAWRIDGAKQWISSGAYAGVLLVWARTAPPETGTRGISCFLVDGGAPGLRAMHPEDKMGVRASNTVGLELDGCRVPESALLGKENGGFTIAMSALDGGRIGIAAQATGIARAAFEASVAYAKDRAAFGVPIAEHQAIAFKLADMKAQIDAGFALAMRAAWLKETGRAFSREAAMAKVFASEAAIRVCNDAVQIHGGYGYTRDYPVERHLRDARVTTIYEGTSEIQRVVIARSVVNDGVRRRG